MFWKSSWGRSYLKEPIWREWTEMFHDVRCCHDPYDFPCAFISNLSHCFFFLLHLFAAFGAILQGSLFGLGGMLPASYTTPIMSGQGLAGAFAAFSMICALACMCSSSIALEPSTLCFQVLTLNLVFSSGLWVTGQRFRLLHHSLCRHSPGHRFLPRPAQIGMV